MINAFGFHHELPFKIVTSQFWQHSQKFRVFMERLMNSYSHRRMWSKQYKTTCQCYTKGIFKICDWKNGHNAREFQNNSQKKQTLVKTYLPRYRLLCRPLQQILEKLLQTSKHYIHEETVYVHLTQNH